MDTNNNRGNSYHPPKKEGWVMAPASEIAAMDAKADAEWIAEGLDKAEKEKNALDKQVSGDHYKAMPIQPVEFIHANKIGYFEGNVIKYVSRWKQKNGLADLEKAKHYIELLIELEIKEYGGTKDASSL